MFGSPCSGKDAGLRDPLPARAGIVPSRSGHDSDLGGQDYGGICVASAFQNDSLGLGSADQPFFPKFGITKTALQFHTNTVAVLGRNGVSIHQRQVLNGCGNPGPQLGTEKPAQQARKVGGLEAILDLLPHNGQAKGGAWRGIGGEQWVQPGPDTGLEGLSGVVNPRLQPGECVGFGQKAAIQSAKLLAGGGDGLA